jgi:outer membrane immunogenic protein
MKKILLSLCFVISVSAVNAQEVSLGVSGGYLTEIDAVGISADVIVDITERFGVATNATFSSTDVVEDRLSWFALDLNARYKVFKELYVLAGGEYLTTTFKDKSFVGGFSIGENKETNSEFGINLGSGYKYTILDNVSAFVAAKYVILDPASYFHARLGIIFGL